MSPAHRPSHSCPAPPRGTLLVPLFDILLVFLFVTGGVFLGGYARHRKWHWGSTAILTLVIWVVGVVSLNPARRLSFGLLMAIGVPLGWAIQNNIRTARQGELQMSRALHSYQSVPNKKIPKIIHQIAIPQDRDKWPEKWRMCRDSVLREFPPGEYEHHFWDEAKMRKLIVDHYPWFLSTYDAYPRLINRIDVVRFFFLHHYGGIYLDMDFECLRNFFPQLPQDGRVALVESPHKENEDLQNSLMCSPPGHPFWLAAAKEAMSSRYKLDVMTQTGPQLLDQIAEAVNSEGKKETGDVVFILPHRNFNPRPRRELLNPKQVHFAEKDGDTIYARHYCTHAWSPAAKIMN